MWITSLLGPLTTVLRGKVCLKRRSPGSLPVCLAGRPAWYSRVTPAVVSLLLAWEGSCSRMVWSGLSCSRSFVESDCAYGSVSRCLCSCGRLYPTHQGESDRGCLFPSILGVFYIEAEKLGEVDGTRFRIQVVPLPSRMNRHPRAAQSAIRWVSSVIRDRTV